MLHEIVIFAFLSIPGHALYSRVCHAGFHLFQNSCIHFSTSAHDEQGAITACHSLNPPSNLYIPYDLHEMFDIRDKIAELFTSPIPQYFRLGIKQAPGLAATEGWYYGSGAAISASWCITQPDGAVGGVDERDLLVDPRNPQYCYYDANDTFTANYICEQDGTTLPEGITFLTQKGGVAGNLEDDACDRELRYMCMTNAQTGLIPDREDLVSDLHLLFDFDTDTCVDVDETTLMKGFLRINIVVPELIEGGLVRVYLNQTTECGMKKLVYEFKNSTRCEQQYAESCDLMTSRNGTSTSCDYRCHCEQDGCQIVLYQERSDEIADICEIVYL